MPTLEEVTKNIKWKDIATRVKAYRTIKGINEDQLAEKCGLKKWTVVRLETGRPYKTQNCLWSIINSEQISILWLFTGEGTFDAPDPPEFLPTAITRKRGVGIGKEKTTEDADEGSYEGDTYEFVIAVDAYKRANKKKFLPWTEVHQIMMALGYRKTARPIINPLNGVKK